MEGSTEQIEARVADTIRRIASLDDAAQEQMFADAEDHLEQLQTIDPTYGEIINDAVERFCYSGSLCAEANIPYADITGRDIELIRTAYIERHYQREIQGKKRGNPRDNQ